MTTETIRVVEYKLEVARQQVAELEELLAGLKQKEVQKPKHVDEEESESSSLLEGATLQLVVDWLGPRDILQCLLVAKKWKGEIDHPVMWQQAARRAIPSDMWKAFDIDSKADSQAVSSSSVGHSLHLVDKTYFKKILMSILGRPQRQVNIRVPRPLGAKQGQRCKECKDYWLPSTSLTPENLFLLVDVRWKETGEIFGRWHKSFANWIPSESELGLQMIDTNHQNCSSGERGAVSLPAPPLQGKLDDHFAEFYNPNPYEDVPTYVFDSCSFSFRCVRTDTGESLHLGNDEDFDQHDTVLWAYLDTDIGAPRAQNDAGCRARELWSLKKFIRGGVCLRFNVRPIPPPTGEADGGVQIRGDWRGTTYLLDGLECDFVAYRQDGSYEDYKNLQELLVSLDGYIWS